jgi:Tol biopolymer transport system component
MSTFRGCILLSSTILLLGSVSSGQSNIPAKTETIAYEHGLDDPGHNILLDLDIYSMNADGTNVKALTHDAHNNHLASWSPDGRRLVFISGAVHPDELSIMDRDGGNSRKLRLDSVIISAGRGDGEQRRQGSASFISWATWSPDGKKVAVTFVNPFPTFLLDPDGQDQPHQIFSGLGTPTWSPDGRELAFVVLSTPLLTIYSADADGSMRSRLTSPSMSASLPAWSPDGKQIAFAGGATLGKDQIFVMNQDGSGVRQLTNDPDWESCGQPSWSPDGQRIAFSCRATGSCPMTLGALASPSWTWSCVRRIFVISVQNPAPKLIPIVDQDGVNPAFAPVN